jgi:DNA-binding NtrC family response regulator
MPKKRTRVLVVDDEDAFRIGLCKRLSRRGFETFDAESGERAISIAGRNLLDIALVDIRMPGMDGIELLSTLKNIQPSIEVIILTGVATVDTAIEAMKLGAYDYLSKPCRFDELIILIEKAHEKKRLREQNILMTRELRRLAHAEFIGGGDKAQDIRKFIRLAARADCSVLVEGESGTGKELIAREIHRQSPRADAPFVVLDCGAFPEALLADELFGHKKGAFTTAMESRQGLLEIADGGILLIDEIGEMTPANQVALLRVVETKRFRRIGESKELYVDVRIIASTNRNLRQEVDKGNFREDLFFRLEVMHYVVPPLRERREDIHLLAKHFLRLLNQAKGANKTIRPSELELLDQQDWPGNIRELANLIERGFYLCLDDEISLFEFLQPSAGEHHDWPVPTTGRDCTLSEIERGHILKILASNNWNKKRTAKVLGISRSRLYNLIKKYKIPMSPSPETSSPHMS